MSDTPAGPTPVEAQLIPLGSHAGSQPIPLRRPILVIGSRQDIVRLHLDSSTVSKAHCVIVLNEWGCYIHDLGSRTHTWVNKKQVVDADLKNGDLIQIGRFHFKYQAPQRTAAVPRRAPKVELDVSTLSDPLEINARVIQIGRRKGSDLQFDDNDVSNIHAIIFERNGQRYVRDLGSRTGTWLDGKPAHQEKLPDGVVMKVGPATITVNEIAAETAPSPAAIPLPPMPVPPVAPPQIDKRVRSNEPIELDDIPVVKDETPVDTEELDLSAPGAIPLDEEAIASELENDSAIPLDLELDTPAEVSRTPEPSADTDTDQEADSIDAADDVALPVVQDEKEPEADDVVHAETDETDISPAIESDKPVAVDVESVGDESLGDESGGNESVDVESVGVQSVDAEPAQDEDVLVEMRRGWHGVSREPDTDKPEETFVTEESGAITQDSETIQPPTADDLTDALKPVDESTDDDGAIDIAPDEAAPLPVAISLDEPELPLETDQAGLASPPPTVAEVAEAILPEPSAPVDDAEPIVEASERDETATDEPAIVEPVIDGKTAERATGETTEPSIEEIAETITPEPDETETPSNLSDSSMVADVQHSIDHQPSSELAAKVSVDEALAELDLINPEIPETPVAGDADEVIAPHGVSDETDEDAGDDEGIIGEIDAEEADEETPEMVESSIDESDEPTPVADLSAVDFSSLASDETEDDDSAADTAYGVSEIDPFDLEENETAEPLINLADETSETGASVRGNGGVEVVEETSPTPASAMPLGLDDVLDEALDDTQKIEQEIASDQGADQMLADSATDAEPGDEYERELLNRPQSDDLRDLLPADGPMLGGAFGTHGHEMMIGGSSLVNPGAKDSDIDETAEASEPAGAETDEAAGIDPDEKTSEHSDRRKPLRVGFNAEKPPASESPFAGGKDYRTIADALIGRRGTSSVDVFANPSPTPEDLLLDEKEREGEPADTQADISAEQAELQETFDRFRPRGAISAISSFPQVHVPPVYKPGEDPASQARVRKSRSRTALMCTVLMVLLIGGSAWGIFQYVPVYSKLVSAITFEGLSEASIDRARDLRTIQNDILKDERTRGTAMAELGPAWNDKKGFLSDTQLLNETLVKTPSERWPAANPNQMHLIVMSRDKENDLPRLRALSQAVIKANEAQSRRAVQLREEARAAQNEIESLKAELTKINQKLEMNRAMGESRPDDVKMAAVESRRAAAEQEVKAAIAKRLDIEAAIELLKKQARPDNTPVPEGDAIAADAELKKLNAQMADLQKSSDTARAAAARQNDAARQALDEVIKQFEGELKSAQKLKDNPELTIYLDSANRIFAETRQLTDDLIRRQEQQHTRLSELKQRLSERIDLNNKDALEKDAELKRMRDELGMLTRQQNGALASGETQEAERVSMQMRLLTIKIEEAIFKHQNDPVQQEMIAALQNLIDQTAKSIQEDRKHIDERLTKAQKDFEKNAPAVSKLPAEQKELAESIEKRLAAVAEARKSYSLTADAAEAQQAKIDAETKKQVDELQGEIRARKLIVDAAAREQQAIEAEKDRKKKLDEKQIELAGIRTAEKDAHAALAGVTAELEAMEKHRRDLLETERVTGELTYSKSEKENQVRHLSLLLRNKEQELAGIIAPSPKFDVHDYDLKDARPIYAGIAAAGIFVLLLFPIVYNLRMLSRDHHHPVVAQPVTEANGFDPMFPQDPAELTDADKAESTPATVASR